MIRLSYYPLLIPLSCLAGQADVIDVIVRHSFDNVYNFDVTTQHSDEGWHHHANGWQVVSVSESAKWITVHPLRYPHLREQSFTRNIPVQFPDDIEQVIIRAHDNVHGYCDREITVKIPPATDSHITHEK